MRARAKRRETDPRQHFGGGIRVYNVIDSRQSYPQEIVARGVNAIVPDVGEDASVHLSYEMVALSPAACEALGIELSEEDRAEATEAAVAAFSALERWLDHVAAPSPAS